MKDVGLFERPGHGEVLEKGVKELLMAGVREGQRVGFAEPADGSISPRFILIPKAKNMDRIFTPVEMGDFPGEKVHMHPRSPVYMRGGFIGQHDDLHIGIGPSGVFREKRAFFMDEPNRYSLPV
jgi:hypothetical protein